MELRTDTLTEVCSKFWIPKGHSLVRKLVYCCVICRRAKGTPYVAPPPPPLPVLRVKEDPAFTYTGVDFASPLFIRTNGANCSDKIWICLFTCLVTRAVHLDIGTDMSSESFIPLSEEICCSQRSTSQVSLNGKTFKAASKYLKSMLKDDTVRDHLHTAAGYSILNGLHGGEEGLNG